MTDDDHDFPDLGPCCMCATRRPRNIVLLDRHCAVPGHGWGCVVCGLPSNGACAVLCDICYKDYVAEPAKLVIACSGYPATDGRIAIADLPADRFAHNLVRHEE